MSTQVTASEQSVVIAREKGKADAALEEAIPALEMAESALANLHKEDITEVKNFAKPPALTQRPFPSISQLELWEDGVHAVPRRRDALIMITRESPRRVSEQRQFRDGVVPAQALVQDACLMVVCLRPTGVKLDENWGDAKKMLADTSLLDKLKRYPKDSITEKMMKSVRKYFKNPKMTVENMKSVSKAGMRSVSPRRGRGWFLLRFRAASSDRDASSASETSRTPSTRPTHTSDAVEGPTSDRDAPRDFDRDTTASMASSARLPRRHAVAATLARAGTGLLVWVTAISKYFDVAKNVEPLKAKVRDMEKQQAKTTKLLADLNDQLGVLSKELGELDANFKEKNEELTGLQTQAALMEKRLAAASKLITGLTGERTRWTSDIGALNDSKVQLVGDCLLAASFLSYAGAFTSDFRAGMIYETFAEKVASLNIPVSSNFNLEAFLSSDAVIQDWTAKGLPADEHSVQNGILTTAASRFPLCIDPQQQAVQWIKNMYGSRRPVTRLHQTRDRDSTRVTHRYGKDQLKIKSLSESDFMKHLELAIQFGAPFLFENVDEELDPMLDPVSTPALLRCLRFVAGTRISHTMPGVVSFWILGPFGPSRATATLRA